MVIYTIKQGDTLYNIAKYYGVDLSFLIKLNQISNPTELVVGQSIVIRFPKEIYTVKLGDTIESISNMYNISTRQLLRNNPWLFDMPVLYAGEQIIIEYEDNDILGDIEVNGYAYPYINKKVLEQTLPFLTYITIFTYGFTEDGELIGVDDIEIIDIAKMYNVAPIMLISTLTKEGGFSNLLANKILNNKEAQDKLIENIIQNMKEKGYYGLDIDFEYVLPEDREAYVQFIDNVTRKLNEQGFIVMVALAPKISSEQKGLLYESHDYKAIGEVANSVLVMTYEWGYTYSHITYILKETFIIKGFLNYLGTFGYIINSKLAFSS